MEHFWYDHLQPVILAMFKCWRVSIQGDWSYKNQPDSVRYIYIDIMDIYVYRIYNRIPQYDLLQNGVKHTSTLNRFHDNIFLPTFFGPQNA